MNILLNIGWLAATLLLLGATGVWADERAETLILGTIGNNPNKTSATLQPMVDYAASKLGDVGIVKGEILIARNHEEMIDDLKNGRVDWITETPLVTIMIMEQTGAEILVRRWKDGISEYTSLFFVHKESDIHSLGELRGKSVAFGDRDSTSSYFVPLAILREQGMTPTEIVSPRVLPQENKVTYIMAGDKLNIFQWVRRKLVAAGAASSSDYDKEVHKRPNDFRVIHQSKPLPRSLELVRKELDPKVKIRLKEVLLGAEEDPNAKNALKIYKNTKKFDEITGNALAGMDDARKILVQIQDVLTASMKGVEQ